MTIDNERLIAYLGLEFELCYLRTPTEAVWIVADKIRRKDRIALEMLRIVNRFMRIAKAWDKFHDRQQHPPNVDAQTRANNAPYARCIAVRIRVHEEHQMALRLRVGIDPDVVRNATRLETSALLDPHFELTGDDPVLGMLGMSPTPQASEPPELPARSVRPRTRSKPPTSDDGQ
jgi:hypothetical protein